MLSKKNLHSCPSSCWFKRENGTALTACYFQPISRYLNNLGTTSAQYSLTSASSADPEERHWVKRTETLPACRNACNLSRWKKRETLCVVAVIQLVLWVPRVVYFWELFWRWLPVDAVSAACSKMTTENNKARNECFFTAGACLHDSEGKHRLFGQLQLADEMKAS